MMLKILESSSTPSASIWNVEKREEVEMSDLDWMIETLHSGLPQLKDHDPQLYSVRLLPEFL
jgi:hypothetical protein